MAVAQPDVHSNNHDNNGAFNFEKFHKLKNNGLIRNESDHNSMENQSPASVWAMDCEDGLIVLGCADGRIEIWETMSCQFKVRKFKNICYRCSICPMVSQWSATNSCFTLYTLCYFASL